MFKYVLSLIFAVMLLSLQSHPQAMPDPVNRLPQRQIQKAPDRDSFHVDDGKEPHQSLQEQLLAQSIAERRLALRRDTERLASLAAELKQSVDKTSANVLSMEVIRKAQEIQKLAKSVQDKMKNAF